MFRGGAKETIVERTEKVIRKSAGKIKFSKTSVPQCAQFSRDGRMLVTGTKDGFVEVWDFEKCKLRKDLEYQAKVRVCCTLSIMTRFHDHTNFSACLSTRTSS